MVDIKLGLIGANIATSSAPRLHRLAGQLCGLEVSYALLVPDKLGFDLDATLAHCRHEGFHGVNVTYPYKEKAAARVHVDSPKIRALGAVNTLVFEPSGLRGDNTDYTGFIAAYRGARGTQPPGRVCLIGAGGVGRAVAFGLLDLDVEAIRILDRDHVKASRLTAALLACGRRIDVIAATDIAEASDGVDGIINCTPVGMYGSEGRPIDASLIAGAAWAFDAVYTPLETTFLRDAADLGLDAISGYELFFHQGVDAFRIFSGRSVDQTALRESLLQSE